MMHRKAHTTLISFVAILGAAAAFAVLSGTMRAQALQVPVPAEEVEVAERAEQDPEDLIKVGTFDLQAVFQEHPAQGELLGAFQESQGKMQEAQQAGDHGRLQALQQEFEQKRQEVIEAFKRDVDEALPGVAEESDVVLVAQEVNYVADNVRKVDITRDLLAELIEEDVAEPLPLPMPQR